MVGARRVALVMFCTVAAFMATLQAQDPGCQFTGNSACGGDNRGQCALMNVSMPSTVQTAPPRASVSLTTIALQSTAGESI